MYDVFFISYDEPNADENWKKISSKVIHAKRVHGIKGIHKAHLICAELSFTGMFWTIDGDTVVDDDFDFNIRIPADDRKYLHLWYTRNPVNDLTYGYGAVKLWPRKALLNYNGHWLDFTTSVGNLKIMEDVISTTHYNTSSYSAWRSGFREAIKLCVNMINGNDPDAASRLETWLTRANPVPYASDTVRGAIDGVSYYMNNSQDVVSLKKINDWDWLQEYYENIYCLRTPNSDKILDIIRYNRNV